jgi:hypothetical protein
LFGPLQLKVRLRSTGSGPCSVVWSLQLAFTGLPSKTVPFGVVHDGAWHDYTLVIQETSDGPVQRMQMFLGDGTGTAEIDYIHVFDNRQSLVASWDFGLGQATG